MRCMKCHAELAPGARFCNECGAKVTPKAAATPPPAVQLLDDYPDVRYDLFLTSVGNNPAEVIEHLQTFGGYGGTFAASLIERAPIMVLTGYVRRPAHEVRETLEAAGATVELRPELAPGRSTQRVSSDPRRLTQGLVKSMLQAVVPAMAGPSKPGLNGVRLVYEPGTLTVAASDGRCLLVATHPCEALRSSLGVTLPRHMVVRLMEVLGDGDELLDINFGPSEAVATINGEAVRGEYVVEAFPDFNRLIPKSATHRLGIDRAALVELLVNTSTTMAESLSVWDIENGMLTVVDYGMEKDNDKEVSNELLQDVSGSMAVDYDGQPLRIAFNAQMLRLLLANLDCTELDVWIDTALAPVQFAPQGQSSPKLIVMPMVVPKVAKPLR